MNAAVASMSEEQKDDAFVFLECNTEELAGLPDGWGMQAVANVCTFLDYLPTDSYQKVYPKRAVKSAKILKHIYID